MRALIVSDIHSNIEAFDAVLGDAEARGAVDAVWCAGDIVGYGADPAAVIERLRTRAAVCVAGNHDLAACGKMATDEFNPLAAEAAAWTSRALAAADREYIDGLPLIATALTFTIAHGSLREPEWEYLLAPDQAAAQFAIQQTPGSIVGHSHLPMWFEERPGGDPVRCTAVDGTALRLGRGRFIVNPGSVGQPRDGDPRASYMLYDDAAAGVTWHRVAYDAATTRDKIIAAGLPSPLGDRLLVGR